MINKATILGRLGKKELKPLSAGGSICKLSIATNKKYRDNQGVKQDITTWHYINAFGKLAEIASQFAHVGELIYVEGEIINKKIEDKIYSSITANEIKLIPSMKKQKIDGEPNGNVAKEDELVDDIPF